jgi:hypothetical protein
MFEVVQASWVIAAEIVYKKFPYERSEVTLGLGMTVAKVHVRQCDLQKKVLQESCSCLCSMSVRSNLLTSATPFILPQQSNELIQESWIIFRSVYLLNEQWAQIGF